MHDHLVTALEQLERALLAGDALQSEREMTHTLALFAATPEPARDPRLAPLSQRCERLALALKDKLELDLRGNAASRRAAMKYAGGGR